MGFKNYVQKTSLNNRRLINAKSQPCTVAAKWDTSADPLRLTPCFSVCCTLKHGLNKGALHEQNSKRQTQQAVVGKLLGWTRPQEVTPHKYSLELAPKHTQLVDPNDDEPPATAGSASVGARGCPHGNWKPRRVRYSKHNPQTTQILLLIWQHNLT